MCVQVFKTTELNSDSRMQILVLKHQDSERIRNNLKQKRNLYDFDQNLNKGQLESQHLDHKIFFSNKHLKE